MKRKLDKDVAVEALRISKWALTLLTTMLLLTLVIPHVFPYITKANIFGSIELEFVEKKLENTKDVSKDDFDGAPEKIRKVLIDARAKLSQPFVLWIDNEPENNTGVRLLLEEAGVRFEIAASSKSAKKLLKSNKYDLVISDNGRGLGVPTGLEFYENYKKEAYPPPWFFYSSSLGNKVIDDNAISTNSPYKLIPEVLDILSTNGSFTGVIKNESSYLRAPFWFLGLVLLLILLVLAFAAWIIKQSLILREPPEK